MKKSFPLIIFALLINASSLFAQLRFNYDSIIRIDANDNVIRRELYTYDRYGTENSKTIYEWSDESLTLEGNSMYEKTYDENGNVLIDYRYQWDSNNRTWINSRKTVKQYDANGNYISNYYYSWNASSSVWVGSNGDEREYDENNNSIVERTFEWSENTRSWYVSSEVYGYYPLDVWGRPSDISGMVMTQSFSRLNENDELSLSYGYDNIREYDYLTIKDYFHIDGSSDLIHTGISYILTYPDTSLVTEIFHIHDPIFNQYYFTKYEYAFDEDNFIYTSVTYNNSPDSSYFMPKTKNEIYYNTDSIGYLCKYLQWDGLENIWRDSIQIFYYNRVLENGRIDDTLKITEKWNLDLQIWENYEKEVGRIDEFGNAWGQNRYTWNHEEQRWIEIQILSSKEVLAYNNDGNITIFGIVNWDNSTNAYSDTSYLNYLTYNELGSVDQQEFISYNVSPRDLVYALYNYEYDDAGNEIVGLYEDEYADRTEYTKHEKSYDSNNNLIEDAYFFSNTGINDFELEYTDYYFYTQPSLYFGRGADVDTVFITAEGDWTVRSDVDWISFSPASGSGNGYFIVSVEENTGLEDRFATLVVVSDQEFSLKEEQTQQIVITQVGTGSGSTAIAEQPNEAVIATNLSAGTLTVETDKPAKLELYSYSGQLVMASSIEGSETISLLGLPSGVYQAVIVSDNKVTKETIVVK